MRFEPASRSGLLLWRLLPLVYRRWDGRGDQDPRHPTEQRAKGDLAEYLDAVGTLFDELRATLEQRLDDSSPDTCQSWLIPYFADLLDVRLVSPDVGGQREEVARAIAWRQRKGTLQGIREIARAIGRFERVVVLRGGMARVALPTVIVQEGYLRVATTAVIGKKLPSLSSLGLAPDAFVDSGSPIHAALRPGLQRGTVDFRFLSRAAAASRETLSTNVTAFGDEGLVWRQDHPSGVPCHPNTYQDLSLRTPDVRAPTHAHGHYHPHRVLLFGAPRDGFFPPGALSVTWRQLRGWLAPADSDAPPFSDWEERGEYVARERLLRSLQFEGSSVRVIERELRARDDTLSRELIAGLVAPAQEGELRSERLGSDELTFAAGFVLTSGLAEDGAGLPLTLARSLAGFGAKLPSIRVVAPDVAFDLGAFGGAVPLQRLENLVLVGQMAVTDARVALRRVAIRDLRVNTASTLPGRLLVSAVDSLIDCLEVTGDGICRLEYCTVLSRLACKSLEASDALLLGVEVARLSRLYLRYCCAPWLAPGPVAAALGRAFEVTREQPLFLVREFGSPGSAVLHPAASAKIRSGAEDGGELGAYHGEHHVVREQAVLDKLREFLPVSLLPALIPHAPFARPIS